MSSDDLLDGKAGPEAQADEIMRLLDADIADVLKEIEMTPGNAETVVGGSYPFYMIGRKGAAS